MTEGAESTSAYPDDKPVPSGLVTDAWKGRRWKPDGTDVFCGDRANQPETLFETRNLYVIPDLFPITPGHIMIIPKSHYPAYGATPARWDAEVERTIARAQQFVRDAYGLESMVWENGGPSTGQSVHHAHIHIIPMPRSVTAMPPPQQAVALPQRFLPAVRAWWRSQRCGRPYHIVQFGNDRRLLPGGSPDVRTLAVFKATVLNVERTPDGSRWLRKRDPIETARTIMLWRRWELAHPERQARRGSVAGDHGLAA